MIVLIQRYPAKNICEGSTIAGRLLRSTTSSDFRVGIRIENRPSDLIHLVMPHIRSSLWREGMSG